MASTILNFLLLLLSFFSVRVSAHSIVAPNLQTSAQFAPAADANEAASLRFEPDLLEWWGPVKDGEPNVTLWVSDLKVSTDVTAENRSAQCLDSDSLVRRTFGSRFDISIRTGSARCRIPAR